MAPVVIVDSLGCGLWTVTVDSYSGGLSVEWTVDCELWTVTVVTDIGDMLHNVYKIQSKTTEVRQVTPERTRAVFSSAQARS